MFADALKFTHNGTGGAGNLTVAARTGFPQPSDVFGATLTRQFWYEIAEYSSATLQTLVQYERGLCGMNLSSSLIARFPQVTWLASGPTYSQGSPAALTITNTAANVVITFGNNANMMKPGYPSIRSGVFGALNDRQSFDGVAGTITLIAGTKYYFPIELCLGMPITNIEIDVTTNVAGSLRVGIYDIDTATGVPTNLLTEFTSSNQISLSTIAQATAALPTPWIASNGRYVGCIQGSSGAAIRAANTYGDAGWGNSGGRDFGYGTKTGAYGTLPTTADTGLSYVSKSSGNPPWVGRN